MVFNLGSQPHQGQHELSWRARSVRVLRLTSGPAPALRCLLSLRHGRATHAPAHCADAAAGPPPAAPHSAKQPAPPEDRSVWFALHVLESVKPSSYHTHPYIKHTAPAQGSPRCAYSFVRGAPTLQHWSRGLQVGPSIEFWITSWSKRSLSQYYGLLTTTK